MFKKIGFFFVAVLAAFIFAACSAPANYDDVKAAIEKQISSADTFAAAINSAADAKAAADALTAYGVAYQADMAAFKAVLDKHTEMSADIPADLKDVYARQLKMKDTVSAAVQKLMASPYAQDPGVTEALSKLSTLSTQ